MDINNINYRFALEGEGSMLVAIQANALRHSANIYYPSKALEAWISALSLTEYEQAIRHQEIYVATFDNKPIAFGQFKQEWQEIKELYVKPEFHRNNIASNLVSLMEKNALYSSFNTIKTFSTLNALPFYQKIDFKFKEYKELQVAENVFIKFAEMGKILS